MRVAASEGGLLTVRSASYILRRSGVIAITLATALGLTSCLTSGGSSGNENAPQCEKPFQVVVQPSEIKGSSHIYLPTDQLGFLLEPNLVLDRVELQATLGGKHDTKTDFTLSLNGIKVSRRDGARSFDEINYVSVNDWSQSKFSLHKMFLNGALPIHLFILQVKKNKGELKIGIHGKSTKIIEARLLFSGKRYASCGETPTPPPLPVNNNPGDTQITSITPLETLTTVMNIQLNFSNPIQGNIYYCTLDGRPAEICQSPKVYSNLSNGAHHFEVFAKTASGVAETTPAVYDWVVDSIAPTATITNAGSLPVLVNQTTAKFEFAANEPGNLICSLDGAKFESCQSPHTVAGLSDGVHTFAVNVIDSAGNVGEQPSVFRWSIDTILPITTIAAVSPAAPISNSTAKSFTFSADESAQFECSIDGEAFNACASPFELTGLAEGRHWFEVRARDAAGNLGSGSTYAWTIDLKKPVIIIGAMSPPLGTTNATSISLEFGLSEAAVVNCQFNMGVTAPCVSPLTYSNLTEGKQLLVISAVDEAGNASDLVELNWLIDSTSPEISFGEITPMASFINQQNLRVLVNASENSELRATLNGAALTQVSSPIELSGLTEGEYTLSIQAQDSAGNLSNIIDHNFVVDLTLPVITLTSMSTGNPVNMDSRSFNLQSSEFGTFECQLDGAGFAACENVIALSGLADGEHTYEARAIDLAGNVSTVASSSWVVDTRAPTVVITAERSGSNFIFAFSSDEAPVNYECSLDGSTFASCVTGVSYTITLPGQHVFTARATDAAGNRSESGTSYAFAIVFVETFISGAQPSALLTSQRSISLSFAADQPGATFMCSLDGGTDIACVSPVAYSGLADGDHQIKVYAVDAYGTPDASPAVYSWAVDGAAPIVRSVAVVSTTRNTVTISWVTNEAATSQLKFGLGSTINQSTAETNAYVTSHSVILSGLTSNTIYSYQVAGRDSAGNVYLGPTQSVRTAR